MGIEAAIITDPRRFLLIHNTTRKGSHQANASHLAHITPASFSCSRRATYTALTDTDQSRHTPGQPRVTLIPSCKIVKSSQVRAAYGLEMDDELIGEPSEAGADDEGMSAMAPGDEHDVMMSDMGAEARGGGARV